MIPSMKAIGNRIIIARQDENIYTTHSESTRPVHVPIFQRYPVNVPHPIPIAVPQYVKVKFFWKLFNFWIKFYKKIL